MRFLLTTIMLSLALPLGAAEVPKKIPLTPEAFYAVRDGKTVFGTIRKKWKSQKECFDALEAGIRKHPKFTTHGLEVEHEYGENWKGSRPWNFRDVKYWPPEQSLRIHWIGYASTEVNWRLRGPEEAAQFEKNGQNRVAVSEKIFLTPEVYYVDWEDGKTVFGTIKKAWKSKRECEVTLELGVRKHPKFSTHAFKKETKWTKNQFLPENSNPRYAYRGYAFKEVVWGSPTAVKEPPQSVNSSAQEAALLKKVKETVSAAMAALKESPYLYEDESILSYQEKYAKVGNFCVLVMKLEIETSAEGGVLRDKYEKESGGRLYPASAKEPPVWHSKLKESLRDMKPSSTDWERHAELVKLGMSAIALSKLNNSEVSAIQFVKEAMEISKDYIDSYRKVKVYFDVD